MSLAWGSLVVLLLLLPGVLFFVGIYIPEKFTRETSERSALGQLAAVLVVSFVVQAGLFGLAGIICRRWEWVPCIDLHLVIRVLLLDKPAADVSVMLALYVWWIVGYLLLAAAFGAVLGFGAGWAITSANLPGDFLRGLTQHPWVHDLSVGDNLTVAYVMTHVRQDRRVLVYEGYLRQFGLLKDGRFAYLVLTSVKRGYIILEDSAPVTSNPLKWKEIGSAPASMIRSAREGRVVDRAKRILVIEGEDVANVVFEKFSYEWSATVKAFEAELMKIRETLKDNISDAKGARTGVDTSQLRL